MNLPAKYVEFWCSQCDESKPREEYSRTLNLLGMMICKKCDAELKAGTRRLALP